MAPETALVGRPVGVDHGQVDRALVQGVEPLEEVGDLAVDVRHGVEHALAPVAVATVAQLDRLVGTGRGARRDDGPTGGARVENHLHLDGGIAAGVEDFPADYLFDQAHCAPSLLLAVGQTLPPAPLWTRAFIPAPLVGRRSVRSVRYRRQPRASTSAPEGRRTGQQCGLGIDPEGPGHRDGREQEVADLAGPRPVATFTVGYAC